ncbi:MAG: cob(I)yrinic acid a,c-diamide adenosyltransferase [Prolixibacteraceae bacterium]|jgi:cob(I)alamin adenosyltransferase|nr:cob(I)yrinic acid a,c-diamide adenosyltransferase [Prolixibacteraceae bacterium]MDD4754537.1 cob(I)yrinic acid a,c-diamide adenosyltransferase [Prolixibacteraceae bacterium]NLO02001.1 cob(I)yrinic acid a,c-diamide adenosyltransferase [Bacteroidales bacterium]
MKGYIQVYTGNGKGKTTAALGLALRAAGAGKKIFFAQFVKGRIYSETEAVKKYIPEIKIKQYGLESFILNTPTDRDIDAARKGLSEVSLIIEKGLYDMVILDEASIAVFFNLFSSSELIDVIKKKKPETEIVVTGRHAPAELIEFADLVTEMKDIKHYYTKGVEARKGIEY